jgi:hypothetical protein
MENSEEFESQFKGSPLAEAMGASYRSAKEFYREYVTKDYNHETVSRISKSTALAMIESSPYRKFLKSPWQIQLRGEVLTGMMNKGAIRITPSQDMMGQIIEDVIVGTDEEVDDWLDTEYGGDVYQFSEHYRNEIWVYNHDSTYYITRPLKTPKSGGS